MGELGLNSLMSAGFSVVLLSFGLFVEFLCRSVVSGRQSKRNSFESKTQKHKIREHDANSHLGGQGARPEAANVTSTH